MSKGNLFLGYARGKVGDVVFSHQDGGQITRARNRSPKNPKSPLQTLQRICMNSSSKAYSVLQDICNHSFEGYAVGTPCQSEFMRLNVEKLRNKLAYQIAYPFDDVMREADAWNYNQKGDAVAVANEWIVSTGTLEHMRVLTSPSSIFRLYTPYKNLTASATYQDVVEGLGLQRGDQLTFLVACQNTSSSNPYLRTLISGFTYARIILEPASGDMTTTFLTGSNDSWAVNSPNSSNEGTVLFGELSGAQANILVNSVNHIAKQGDEATTQLWPILGAVIASRRVGSRWLRSTQNLQWTRTTGMLDGDTFGLAYLSYQDAAGSSLYLNQAE
ncbi:MAG: hypothetical protein IKL02_05165 [Kiritimatiellae bacterium]|nr:hypothetical protein [Kiritimatiellia bacterium]MBR6948196.1 hypothetical protein [Muribaculaceae bacterium]